MNNDKIIQEINVKKTAMDYWKKFMQKSIGSMLANSDPVKSAINDLQMRTINMSRDFNSYFTKTGYAISESQIEHLDTIDMTTIFSGMDYVRDNANEKLTYMPRPFQLGGDPESGYITKGPAINMLPCFEQGSVKVNKKRYIVWKIKTLKLEEAEIKADICLWNYVKSHNGWNLTCMVNTILSDFIELKAKAEENRKFMEFADKIENVIRSIENKPQAMTQTIETENGKIKFDLSETNGLMENDCYICMLDYHDQQWFAKYVCDNINDVSAFCHWTEREHYIMKNIVAPSAGQYGFSGKELAQLTVFLFYDIIGYVNEQLKNKKVKKKTTSISKKTEEIKMTTTINKDAEQPEQMIHVLNVGEKQISFKSDKKPKAATEKLMRTYSVATWKRRATTRVYKNGKTIHVKESVCHRKGFESVDGEVPQSIMRINKSKIENI